MRVILYLFLLFILASCVKADFYVGTWELNEATGVSTLSLSQSGKLNWDISGIPAFEEMTYEAVWLSGQKVMIIAGRGEDCIRLTLEPLSDHHCLGWNYKCHTIPNLIDEVFIARKNGHPPGPIPKPEKETIVLPNGFNGEFFMVYPGLESHPSGEIAINANGIGINPGPPDLKQLFNPNRVYRFEGQQGHIPIGNPNQYGKGLDARSDSVLQKNGVVIIQKGYNQSPRNKWNDKHGVDVADDVNVEYFEVRRKER